MDAGERAIISVAARLMTPNVCLGVKPAVMGRYGAISSSATNTKAHVATQIPRVMHNTCPETKPPGVRLCGKSNY